MKFRGGINSGRCRLFLRINLGGGKIWYLQLTHTDKCWMVLVVKCSLLHNNAWFLDGVQFLFYALWAVKVCFLWYQSRLIAESRTDVTSFTFTVVSHIRIMGRWNKHRILKLFIKTWTCVITSIYYRKLFTIILAVFG